MTDEEREHVLPQIPPVPVRTASTVHDMWVLHRQELCVRMCDAKIPPDLPYQLMWPGLRPRHPCHLRRHVTARPAAGDSAVWSAGGHAQLAE